MTAEKKAKLLDLIGITNRGAIKRSFLMLLIGLFLISIAWAGKTYLEPNPIELESATAIPNISDSSLWINSEPIRFDTLKTKALLLEFWTYSCFNCRNTISHMTEWDVKYRDSGLVIVGVHCPEFSADSNLTNIRRAVEKHGIKYPVVADNSFRIWTYFHNHWWPRLILVAPDGTILHDRIGEGAYEETEAAIRSALASL